MDIMKKVINQINSMNSIAKKVIVYGFRIFVAIIFISLTINIVNKYLLGNVYKITISSIDLFKSSFSVLAISIIGGLIMDYISRNG